MIANDIRAHYGTVSRDEAGKAVGVSGRSVGRAREVARVAPELADKVRAGEMTLHAASVEANLNALDRYAEAAKIEPKKPDPQAAASHAVAWLETKAKALRSAIGAFANALAAVEGNSLCEAPDMGETWEAIDSLKRGQNGQTTSRSVRGDQSRVHTNSVGVGRRNG